MAFESTTARLEAELPTPDFYRYRWSPIATATIDGRFVEIGWPDSVGLSAVDWWLRENAVGGGGVDPATREGILDPADHDDNTTIAEVEVTSDGALRVTWEPGRLVADYHPGWLRHIADGNHRPDSWLPKPKPWTAAELAEPPTHDGAGVLDDESTFGLWITDLLRYGIARLRNCPADPDFSLKLGSRIGAIRDTNFGPIWDVKADIEMVGADIFDRLAEELDRLRVETPVELGR